MSLLRIKNKKAPENEDQLVGAYLPQPINAYLTLYTIALGMTKSALLREMIDAWIGIQRQKTNEKELIKIIVRKLQFQWKIEKSTKYNPDIEEYIRTLTKELNSKGVDGEHIELLIKSFRDATNEKI